MARRWVIVCFFSVLCVPGVCFAQEKTQYLTWIRYFRAQPGEERELTKLLKDVSSPALDGMVEKGTLLSWGIFVPFTRTDDVWTHGVWLSTVDWAHMDEVIKSFEAAGQARSALENQAVEQRFQDLVEPGSIHDEVLRNLVVPAPPQRPPSAEAPAYFRVATYKVRPGQEESAVALYRQVVLPIHEQLMSDGTIIDGGLAVRTIVSDSEWTHASWVLLSNLGAMDQAQRAFAKADEARTEQEREQLEQKLEAYLDADAYRSQILRIVHYGGPKPAAK